MHDSLPPGRPLYTLEEVAAELGVELGGPDCAMTDAAPWLLLAAAWVTGLGLTAGWIVRAAWAIAHDPAAIEWLRR